MRFITILFCIAGIYILPNTSFSQESGKYNPYDETHRMERKSVGYYIRKSRGESSFSISMEKFFTGLRRYQKKDTLLAYKLIKKLEVSDKYVLSRLAIIRLKWEVESRLEKSSLDSVRLLLRNKSDSAAYYYTLGLFFQDSVYERIARKFGFVRAAKDGNEITDWRKMTTFRWESSNWRSYFFHAEPEDVKKIKIAADVIIQYKNAIELDPQQFNYTKQLILFTYCFSDDKIIPALISSAKGKYNDTAEKWLSNFLGWYATRKKDDTD